MWPDVGSAVACRGLVRRFADVVAVRGLDLEITRGECFGILGPNGAGKTTTVEMLMGLDAPDEGSIEVLGRRWRAGEDDEIRRRIGAQLQETRFPERLSVEETLRLFRSFYREGREVEELLELLGLLDKRRAWTTKLSGGQRQRLALACALVSRPELLFLDEPTTGLDPNMRQEVWTVIREYVANGGTACMTTHYMEEASQLCSRVAIMDAGRVIALGTPAELVARLGAPQLIEVHVAPPLASSLFDEIPGVTSTVRKDGGFLLSVPTAALVLPEVYRRAAANGSRVTTLATREATLEDVFIQLTGRVLSDD